MFENAIFSVATVHENCKRHVLGGGSVVVDSLFIVVVDSLFIVAPIVSGFCVWPLFCYAVPCVCSSFAIMWLMKRGSWLLYLNCFLDAMGC